jgi:uncharacterized membrane protein
MNKLYVSAMTLAIGLALSSGAGAANMSKDEYKAAKESIRSETSPERSMRQSKIGS